MSKLITDKAELIRAIDSIAKRGKALDHDIQIAGCSALAHLKAHGDVGMVNRLFLALSKGARKAAMTSWLLAYGSLVANVEKNKDVMPFRYDKSKETNVEGALVDPWFDHKPDPAPDEVFDLQKAILTVIKKAQGKELAHAELLSGLESLAASVSASDMDEEDLNKITE